MLFLLRLSEKFQKTLSEMQALPSSEITLYLAFELFKKDEEKNSTAEKDKQKTALTLKNLDRLSKNG